MQVTHVSIYIYIYIYIYMRSAVSTQQSIFVLHPSESWYHLVWQMDTSISQKYSAFVFENDMLVQTYQTTGYHDQNLQFVHIDCTPSNLNNLCDTNYRACLCRDADNYQNYILAYFKHHTSSLLPMYYMLGISLCNLRMCFLTFDLWLLTYGQYGHCCWGILPHSSFICLLRLVLHTYVLPQLVQEWLDPWDSTGAVGSSRLAKSVFQPVSILVSSTSFISPKQDDEGWYVDISVKNKKHKLEGKHYVTDYWQYSWRFWKYDTTSDWIFLWLAIKQKDMFICLFQNLPTVQMKTSGQ